MKRIQIHMCCKERVIEVFKSIPKPYVSLFVNFDKKTLVLSIQNVGGIADHVYEIKDQSESGWLIKNWEFLNV